MQVISIPSMRSRYLHRLYLKLSVINLWWTTLAIYMDSCSQQTMIFPIWWVWCRILSNTLPCWSHLGIVNRNRGDSMELVFRRKCEFYLFYYHAIFSDLVLSVEHWNDAIAVKKTCRFKFRWIECKIKVKRSELMLL